MRSHAKVQDIARGRWRGILVGFGLTDRQLSGKHCPCPICGGTDRFRFDDQEGRGTWFCSHCGAGDGVELVKRLHNCDFKTAAAAIEEVAGTAPISKPPSVLDMERAVANLVRTWSKASPLAESDEAARYLAARGLAFVSSDALRLHPGLDYWDDRNRVGKFPTLLARLVGPDGRGVTLHRTYLHNGNKAPVPRPRKLMSGRPVAGAAVRLFPVATSIGIAEGIETALAAAQLFHIPVWSCCNANGVEAFDPPDEVRSVTIFGDNDHSFTGQEAAFACAKRLKARGVAVEVSLPTEVGDWLDVLNRRNVNTRTCS